MLQRKVRGIGSKELAANEAYAAKRGKHCFK